MARPSKITGHWGEDAVGFKWTEQDSVDDRLKDMDTGRFYSATIVTPSETTLKGIAVRIGENQEAAVLFDTELLRVSCGWTGEFLKFDPARYGIIAPPKVGGTVVFSSPRQPGWAREGQFQDPRPKPFGPLPREWAKYRGLYLHGNRVVFMYSVGQNECEVLESPWLETVDGERCLTREMDIAPSDTSFELLFATRGTKVKLVCEPNVATLVHRHDITVVVSPHDRPVRLKLLFPFSEKSAQSAFQKQNTETQIPRISQKDDQEKSSLQRFLKPGPSRWTAGITTRGVVSQSNNAFVVDTLTLPFGNPYKALLFVSGHDFFEDLPLIPNARPRVADAAVCTLHGDVWLVNGIDDKLTRLTWKRFATGLFQPLGLKIVKNQIYVVGRDQITRLHDLNGDGEADWYENFNNDAQVSANGHEYVTCLETDSDGWFYFLKGNCDGRHDHDGCLLRVSPDGQKLEVFATGFRNANGLGIWEEPATNGAREVITVAPQEGEWTPGSAIFQAQRNGFYGYVPSAHRVTPPKEFALPLCWIPRLQDNSSGGQVQIPINSRLEWKLLAGMPLHFSYGTSRMFLLLCEQLPQADREIWQGGTVPLPVSFESGVMRGRFRSEDGSLYVSGLRGWVSNAAKDGCLQRVRVTANRLDEPIAFGSYRNGLLIRFSDSLDAETAADTDNYHVQRWNYRWSAAYGSPEFKVSNPREEGRDEVEVLSATHIRNLKGGDAVFLELSDMRPVNQLSMKMTLRNVLKQPIERRLDATIHALRNDLFPVETNALQKRPGQLADDVRNKLVPGLQLSMDWAAIQKHSPTRERIVRMAAWRFEPQDFEAAISNLKSPISNLSKFTLSAQGYVVAPRRGKYQFSAVGTAPVEIAIGDVTHRLSEPREIELARGFNTLRIVQQVSGEQLQQPISLRLLWSSEAFEPEPVPPTALFCEPLPHESQLLERGRGLFVRHLCVRCHRVSDDVLKSKSAMPELNIEAPDLTGVGSRLRREWLTQWLLDPRSTRHDARMPRLFPQALAAEHKQQIADIVEYLASLNETASPAIHEVANSTPRAAMLWEDLGCIGCHSLEPDENRMSLHHAKHKFQPVELARYLQEPQRHSPWNRMGDFQLSANEASTLAKYIQSAKSDDVKPIPDLPDGDVHRGRTLFGKLNCQQCHRVAADHRLPAPPLPSVFGKTITNELRGCLRSGDQRSLGSTDFGFNEDERQALLAFVSQSEIALLDHSPADASRRLFVDLQCQTCHPRNGQSSRLPAILDEFGERGLPPEIVPNLTWAGEKLHATWTRSLLAGHVAERSRPWMKLRMPSFPAYARALADGFAREHGLSDRPESRTSIESDLAPIGEALAARAGLLDCRQCHPIGSLPPTGDKSTLLAPGINFSLTRERMRVDYFRRFMLDPPRYDVTTRMPKLAADGRTTKVTNVFDGDARRQFEAVWHYLQTVPSATHDP